MLIAGIMSALAATLRERVWAATRGFDDIVRLGAGLSIVASVFLVVQLLLFLEELWWRP